MAHSAVYRAQADRILRRLLSVPLYTKILGIVVVGGFAFGAVTLFEVWTRMVETHARVTRERADSLADGLAAGMEAPLAAGDLSEVRRRAEWAAELFPACVYVRVRDRDGQSLTEIVKAPEAEMLQGARETGVREVQRFIGADHAASVAVGLVDDSLDREMATVIWPLVWTLGLCLVVSEGLALIWARLLIRPIHNLVQATRRIQAGDFASRACVYAEDEIGQLATAFNAMAESLQQYRAEVTEKEAARQKLLAKIVQAQEEERKVVSRELHDQLGQSLSKVLLSLQSVHRECACVSTRCVSVESEVRDAIDEVRQLAWAMRPSILDDFGLEAALGRYAQDLSKRVGFAIDYRCVSPPEAPRLPSAVEVTLYRVTQEATTNIIRHAEPNRASIVLLRRGGEVTLLVEDDGRGFDVGRHRSGPNGHLGIIGMEERVGLIGGNLAIESRPGGGTAVRVRIPLNGKTECPSAF